MIARRWTIETMAMQMQFCKSWRLDDGKDSTKMMVIHSSTPWLSGSTIRQFRMVAQRITNHGLRGYRKSIGD